MQKKISILGGLGKMGREIVFLLLKKDNYSLSIIDNASSNLFETQINISNNLNNLKTDILIDFSSPSSFKQALNFSYKNNVAFISGTTNLTKDDIKNMQKYSLKIPIIYSENFSIGIALLKKILLNVVRENTSKVFGVTIEEKHHKNKKDAPSGTAKMLGKIIGNKVDITSVRKGSIPGTHTIILTKENEQLSISHELSNRQALAEGVIKAIEFIKDKKNGLYSLEDIF